LGPAFRISAPPRSAYILSFDYEFPGRSQIYIRGIGLVNAKGRLHYIHSGDTIEFLDAPDGKVLYTLPIEHSITMMGGGAPSIPDEAEFPKESRHGHWRGQNNFAEDALNVLEKYFHSGYRAYEKDNSLFYLTTFAECPPMDDGTRTEVSVLISHPTKADAHDVPFTVAFVARERRSHTEWRDTLSDSSRKRSETFVDDLLTALQRQDSR
jgi:hypothetical protein